MEVAEQVVDLDLGVGLVLSVLRQLEPAVRGPVVGELEEFGKDLGINSNSVRRSSEQVEGLRGVIGQINLRQDLLELGVQFSRFLKLIMCWPV